MAATLELEDDVDQAMADAAKAYGALVQDRPSMGYVPGRRFTIEGEPVPDEDNGQLQFHMAPHVLRQMAPGNGFGKTACVAVEIDWWGFGDHPWQEIPTRPRQMVWVATKYQQWGLIARTVSAWWPSSVVSSFVGSPHWRYTWPTGSTLSIVTAETDEKTLQGIEPDLVVFDEKCPAPLFHEFMKRRRGKTRTRFCITATATDGLDWMYHEVYVPWLEYHKARHLTEREAMRVQGHRYPDPALADLPGIWSWPMGSHRDNPTATAETWAFYLHTTGGSEAERAVRLYGGFREFAGLPVFNPQQLEWMREDLRGGKNGRVVRGK